MTVMTKTWWITFLELCIFMSSSTKVLCGYNLFRLVVNNNNRQQTFLSCHKAITSQAVVELLHTQTVSFYQVQYGM